MWVGRGMFEVLPTVHLRNHVYLTTGGVFPLPLLNAASAGSYFLLVKSLTSASTAGKSTPATGQTIQVVFQPSVAKLQAR